MKLKYRLSEDEIIELQNVMLHEPLPPSKVISPTCITSLLGKGLVRVEHNFWWPCWEAISKSS